MSNKRKREEVPISVFGESVISDSTDIEKNFIFPINFDNDVLSKDLKIIRNKTIEENLFVSHGVEFGGKNKENGLFCNINKEGIRLESKARKGILLGNCAKDEKDDKDDKDDKELFQGRS